MKPNLLVVALVALLLVGLATGQVPSAPALQSRNGSASASIDQARRSLKRRRRRRRRKPSASITPQICRDIANKEFASTFSQCAAETNFAGHKPPSEGTQTQGALAVCSELDEESCTTTQGCQLVGPSGRPKTCIDVTSNAYCDRFSTKSACEAELEIGEVRTASNPDAGACAWAVDAALPAGGKCMLRYQDCSQLGPHACVETDGCMWFNDLVKGHNAGPSATSSRNRCMADPCFRVNNGRCTLQHTGGRCVWFTREQNLLRGFNFPGCYTSPCNNRFKKKDCRSANADATNPYKCVWCGKVNGLKLGCQNAEPTSKAQCWNIKNAGRNSPVPEWTNTKCTNCLQQKPSEDGKCHLGSAAQEKRCFESCCQGPYCKCLAGGSTSSSSGSSGLNLGGSGTGDGA